MDGAAQLPTIVYIAGFVRGGSTILDMLLGENDASIAVGEVHSLFEELQRQVLHPQSQPPRCSCGEPLRQCPFWSEVLTRYQQAVPDIDYQRAQVITARVESVPDRWFNTALGQDYQRIWGAIFGAVSAVSNRQVVVDSSKTLRGGIYRPQALRDSQFSLRLLHLVRDPRAVILSRITKTGLRMSDRDRAILAWKIAAQWTQSNILTASLYQHRPHYARLRFEDFLDAPIEHLRDLGQRLDLDMQRAISLVEADESIASAHVLRGNVIRHQGAVKLQRRAKSEPAPTLPRYARLAGSAALVWARRYGY